MICYRHVMKDHLQINTTSRNMSWCHKCGLGNHSKPISSTSSNFNLFQGGNLKFCSRCPVAAQENCCAARHRPMSTDVWPVPERDRLCRECTLSIAPLNGEIVWLKNPNYRFLPLFMSLFIIISSFILSLILTPSKTKSKC